jgi:prophage antirepressor-like protein
MKSLVTFTFDGHDIRVILDNKGAHWFVGRDVCVALGFRNPNSGMPKASKTAVPKPMKIKDRLGRDREVRVLTLDETLSLINRFSVPAPLAGFESWLINEVLPKMNAQAVQSKRGV